MKQSLKEFIETHYSPSRRGCLSILKVRHDYYQSEGLDEMVDGVEPLFDERATWLDFKEQLDDAGFPVLMGTVNHECVPVIFGWGKRRKDGSLTTVHRQV